MFIRSIMFIGSIDQFFSITSHTMFIRLLPVLWLISTTNASIKIMESRLVNFYQCPDKPNIPVVWKDMVVKRINAKESRIYGEIIISKTITFMKLLLEMYKCASVSETHTCEYYTSLKLSSVCDKIEKQTLPWYQYWNGTELPKKCPLPPGKYAVKGVKFGMDTAFPLFDGYWKFKNKGLSKNGNMLNCFFIEFDIQKRYKL